MTFDMNRAHDLLARAKRLGATSADLLFAEGEAFTASVRLGQVEKIKDAREKVVGLRIFVGYRQAMSATSDLADASLDGLIEDTLAMARVTADDPDAGLPEREEFRLDLPDLGLWEPEPVDLTLDRRIDLARETEAAALSSDARLTNSDGAEFGSSSSRILFANSHGFRGEYAGATYGLSVVPIAAENGSMQRDHWYSVKRRFALLDSPESIGKEAARRTLRRLGARRVKTQRVPVVFDPEVSAGLIGQLAGAVSGYAIYKGASFLVDRLGEAIAAPGVTIVDDGTIPAGLGSKPFDGEGLPTRRTVVVENGVLKSYLLDTYSARKLKLHSTGNATRGPADAPTVSPTNFYLEAGAVSPEEIVREIPDGFYVTELIGFGVNLVNGDYSRGAVGLWISGGELAFPVEEVTIAGNLKEMLGSITRIGNDLVFRGRIAAPTIRIDGLTVAGA